MKKVECSESIMIESDIPIKSLLRMEIKQQLNDHGRLHFHVIIENDILNDYMENVQDYEPAHGSSLAFMNNPRRRFTMTTIGQRLLNAGYESEFVAGMLANIMHEGGFGQFEGSNSAAGIDSDVRAQNAGELIADLLIRPYNTGQRGQDAVSIFQIMMGELN